VSGPVPLTAAFVTGVEGVGYLATAGPVDPTRGGQATLGTESLTGAAGGPRSFDSDFRLELGVMAPGGLFSGPWLDVSGHLNGSVARRTEDLNLSGGFDGAATSAVVRGAASGAAVPAALQDLSLHPGRIHVTGAVTDGYLNDLVSRLTIDPPAPPVSTGDGLASLSPPGVTGPLG
jgi:hypothetical protein